MIDHCYDMCMVEAVQALAVVSLHVAAFCMSELKALCMCAAERVSNELPVAPLFLLMVLQEVHRIMAGRERERKTWRKNIIEFRPPRIEVVRIEGREERQRGMGMNCRLHC